MLKLQYPDSGNFFRTTQLAVIIINADPELFANIFLAALKNKYGNAVDLVQVEMP